MTKKLVAQDVIDYEKAVTDLTNAKKKEIDLRNKIINAFRYTKTEGVEHKSVDGLDIDIVITLGLNRKLDEKGLEAIWDNLSDEQMEAVKYSPKLVNSKFQNLIKNDEIGELINVVTEKPSQATVKLKFDIE